MFKLMLLPHTRVGMTRKELQAHLERVHGPLVMSLPTVGGQFTEYVHYYVVDDATDPILGASVLANCDDLTIVGFGDQESCDAVFSDSEYRAIVQPDERNFSEPDSIGFIAQEFVERRPTETATRLFHFRRAASGAEKDLISERWRERLRPVLAAVDHGSGLKGYVHNKITLLGGGESPWDFIDEIVIAGSEGLHAFGKALREAEAGLFRPEDTAAIITTPNVIVAR